NRVAFLIREAHLLRSTHHLPRGRHDQRVRCERIRSAARCNMEPQRVVVLQAQLAGLQCFVVGRTQKRRQQLSFGGRCIPVNVEPVGVCASPTLCQNVPPPCVLCCGGHVIRHDIQQQPHVALCGGPRQMPQRLFAPPL